MNRDNTVDPFSSQDQQVTGGTEHELRYCLPQGDATTGKIDHMAFPQFESGPSQVPFFDDEQAVFPDRNHPLKPLPLTAATEIEESSGQWMSTPLSVPPPKNLPGRRQIALMVTILSAIMLAGMLLFSLLLASPQSNTFISAVPALAPVGQIVFASSGQFAPNSSKGLNDMVTIDLHSLGIPVSDKSYYAWLMPDQSNDQVKPLLLGTFVPTHGNFHLAYTSPDHTDLLATFSAFRVTEEDSSSSPVTPTLDPTLWRYVGSIANTPTPGDEQHYSLLSHLRHLLAKDPTLDSIGLSGGLGTWLYRNTQKIMEYTTAARDGWASGPSGVDLLRRQVIRTLQYLDGANYSWQDTPIDTPWLIDNKAGQIGLLDVTTSQNPPGYLSHVALHLSGLVNAPGSTPEQKQHATKIDDTLKKITRLYKDIRADAIKLVKMSNQQVLQPDGLSLLDDMAAKASAAYAGQPNATTGELQQGITWVHGQLQTLASFAVTPVKR